MKGGEKCAEKGVDAYMDTGILRRETVGAGQ